jgi:type I restriction enzyme S subunit
MELVEKRYKRTQIGLIPDDWDIYVLGNLLNRIADVDHYMPETHNYGIPYVMTGDLKDYACDIDFDRCKKISREDYEKLSKKIKNSKGDIILARYATVGTVSYVNIDLDFVVSYSCVTIKPDNSRLVDLYLYYYFKSNIFKLEVKNKVNANIQDNVGISDLLKMQIPIPPTKAEQTAIATALSNVDALINSLEKLIAKKRMIKQGAMQQLLQLKEGWGVKKLGDLADMFSGGTPSTSNGTYYNGNIPWVVIADITKAGKFILETEKSISNDGFINSSAKLFKKGVLLFAMYASIGKTTIALMDTTCNQAILGIQPHSIDKEYLYYFLSYNERKFATMGQTGTQSNLSKDMVQKIEIPYPIMKEEQTRIATILSDMDEAITALEAKLEKYQKVKLGMMQNLLTGKIRLI